MAATLKSAPSDLLSVELTTTNNTTDLAQDSTPGENEGKKTKKIMRKKRRPARPQVDPSTMKSEPPPQSQCLLLPPLLEIVLTSIQRGLSSTYGIINGVVVIEKISESRACFLNSSFYW